MAHILMIIGHDGFRDEEYFEPKQLLEDAGHHVTTTSKQNPAISKIAGKKVQIDILFQELITQGKSAHTYDAIVFVGGPGATTFLEDKQAHQLAWDFYNNGKLVTAICIAPVILANAGLLIGKKATVWPGAKQKLCNGNCIYTPDPVVKDGRIITANGPKAANEFGETITQKLAT